MLPGSYEFAWTPDRLIFLGAFFGVLATIGVVMMLVFWQSTRASWRRGVETIRWRAEFHDLRRVCRRCRHALTGRAPERICPHGFDCRHCGDHDRLAALPAPGESSAAADAGADEAASDSAPFGLSLPGDRRYHRGHTWVRVEADATLTIGLDDFGRRLLGRLDAWDLPEVGAALEVHGGAAMLTRGGQRVRVLSPVAGTVTAVGSPREGWLLKVRPDGGEGSLKHLLSPEEARAWMLAELERLQVLLSPSATGPSLADGGRPVDDLPAAMPSADWDRVYGEIFLES